MKQWLLVIGLCGWAAAGRAATLCDDVRALQVQCDALQECWRSKMAELHKDNKGIEFIRADCRAAAMKRDVGLIILRSQKTGIKAWCWVPGISRRLYEVKSTTLTPPFGAKRAEEVIINARIDVSPGPDLDSLERDLYFKVFDACPIKLNLKMKLAGSRLTGTYQLVALPFELTEEQMEDEKYTAAKNTIPNSSGRVEGSITRRSELPPLFEDAPTFVGKGESDTYSVGAAAEIERMAEWFYQGIRRIELMQRYGLSYTDACKQAPVPTWVREPLDLRKEAKKDDGAPPSLDGIGGDDELGDDLDMPSFPTGRRPGGKKDSKHNETLREARKRLASMKYRITTMARLAMAACEGADAPKVARNSVVTDDPEFGPWYGEQTLEIKDEAVNILPAGMGTAGGQQDWVSVTGWKALNPFPLTSNEFYTPLLLDVVLTGDETVAMDEDRVGRRNYHGRGWQKFKAMKQIDDFGSMAFPLTFRANPHTCGYPQPLGGYLYGGHTKFAGGPNVTHYAMCNIKSPEDLDLWCGMTINTRCRLWINDKLAFVGPSNVDPLVAESSILLKLKFRQGMNRLMLRIDTDFSSPSLNFKLCRRGAPATAAEVAERDRKRAAKYAEVKPSGFLGWRGDGSGRFLASDPPVAWHRKSGRNVLWHTPLPYWANGTAIPVQNSNKLLVTMEPHWLICLDKDTGKTIWKKAATVMDLLSEADRKKGWDLYETWWKARELAENTRPDPRAPGGAGRVPKWRQYEWYWAEGTGIFEKGDDVNERDGASAEMIALLDKRDELEASDDPASVQDELNAVLRKIEALGEKEYKAGPESYPKRMEKAKKAFGEWLDFLQKFSAIGPTAGYWGDYTGYAFATPITDGKHIWWKNGMDVAVCYDLDGNEVWKKQTWGSGKTDGTAGSPIMVDGKLIMSLLSNDREGRKFRGKVRYRSGKSDRVLALDAKTGEVAWDVTGLPRIPWNTATPAGTTLTDGNELMPVIVLPQGTVLRAADGKVLVRYCGARNIFDSPVIYNHDTTVYGYSSMRAIKFLMKNPDTVGFKPLWTVRGGPHGGTHYQGVYFDNNMVYNFTGINSRGSRRGQKPSIGGLRAVNGPSERFTGLESFDMATGRYVVRRRGLRKGGNCYSLGSISKRHIYHITGDHIFNHTRPKAPMDMVVFERGRDPLRLANNAMGRTYGGCTMEGGRLFVRVYTGVTCVGYTGDEGRRYEAETVARNVMNDIYQDEPVDIPVKKIKTVKREREARARVLGLSKRPSYQLPGFAPSEWHIIRNVKPGDVEALSDRFAGRSDPIPSDGAAEKVNGQTYTWVPLNQDTLKVAGFKDWELDPRTFIDIHPMRRYLHLHKAIENKAPATTYLLAVVESEKKQTMRFEFLQPGKDAETRAWLAGVKVRHGDRVTFSEGCCNLIIEIRADKIPEHGLIVSPRFFASDDVKSEQAAWRAAVAKRKPYLEKVVALSPDSRPGRLAKRLLDMGGTGRQ